MSCALASACGHSEFIAALRYQSSEAAAKGGDAHKESARAMTIMVSVES